LKTLIDSHVHLDLTLNGEPRRVAWMKENSYHPVSWAFGAKIRALTDLKNYLAFQQKALQALHESGLACHYLTGIHPRNIPQDLPLEAIPTLLGPFLDDPLCLGIGEIGLETGSQREVEVLVAQMELADQVLEKGKCFGIHTPRANKAEVTRQLLSVLKPYSRAKNHMVVDHCTVETIGDVLNEGLWAGITVSPAKSKASDILAILRQYPEYENRIMVNTDSGGWFCEDLFALSQSHNIEEPIKRKILYQNAAGFFGL
jgi:uncharacterized protein